MAPRPRDGTSKAAEDERLASLVSSATGAPRKIALSEVAQHATPRDAWVVINKKVYDVTSW